MEEENFLDYGMTILSAELSCNSFSMKFIIFGQFIVIVGFPGGLDGK